MIAFVLSICLLIIILLIKQKLQAKEPSTSISCNREDYLNEVISKLNYEQKKYKELLDFLLLNLDSMLEEAALDGRNSIIITTIEFEDPKILKEFKEKCEELGYFVKKLDYRKDYYLRYTDFRYTQILIGFEV